MKILIVDDHEVVRTGLRTLLERQEDLEIVGEAATAAEAVDMALSIEPDVVLMDVRLPDESGIEACRKIRSGNPGIRVLMLTSYSSDEAIFSAIMAGASGYLLKQIDAEQLKQAIVATGKGESILDSATSKSIIERVRSISRGDDSRGIDTLTEKEKMVLALIAEGLTNQEIADSIYLSENTVRNYVSSLLGKLGFTHRTQAAVYYLKRNELDED
ncbi:MAG: response regulator transcription factor [Actinobacteria bacterium]|nr:response regulator transcription factor [Actinomycetota bacterium]